MSEVAQFKVSSDLLDVEDETFELELLRNPYSLRSWLRYLLARESSSLEKRVLLYERACSELPGSYKIWKAYLELRLAHLEDQSFVSCPQAFLDVNGCFERALVLLHRMPVMWHMYLKFLMRQPDVTKIRKVFDAALRALPVTQHDDIWALYLDFAEEIGGLFCIHVYRRYIQLEPRAVESYIEVLVNLELWNEAAHQYMSILNRPVFLSSKGKSNYQIWTEFSQLIVQHPGDIEQIDVERVFRAGIHRFIDQAGKLWTFLAQYYIRLGYYEKARSIFYEGITTVMTVRNFTQVFDAAIEFEEQWLSMRMENTSKDEIAVDYHMFWLEKLLDQRSLYINDVILRQNINNVDEWQRRTTLVGDDREKIVQVYAECLRKVNPKLAIGSFGSFFSNFAKFYEDIGDVEQARVIFEKATNVPYNSVNELAQVWINWAEMELRYQKFDTARKLIGDAVQAPKKSTVSFFDEALSPQVRLHKSAKIWMYYLDLEESVGSVDSTRRLYDRMFELKIATPQVVVNCANFLEENGFYEDSFKIYERGVALFSYPVAFELWTLYLVKFIDRFKGKQFERGRDLFEQALEGCPPEFSKSIYLLYADYEEKYGKVKRSISILEKAFKNVTPKDRLSVFNVLLLKVASNYGALAARPVYERAIEILDDAGVKDVCLRYAEMETRLGEIDRARAIFTHGSQYCDPRVETEYWQRWQDFELKYGNPEETVKEMLRIKRSVQVKYSTNTLNIAKQVASMDTSLPSGDAMEQLERLQENSKPLAGFVPSTTGPEGGVRQRDIVEQEEQQKNPDEIELG
ncbi:complexed with Cdc5 protein Cwf3 [Schizosaccharomyces cryophilus OY26]|uniref:Pre-mRNA-splicing factor SYF1 n=1 Tax=Schizosaccharomyces cryophilus (strain OY26 / ATCC MYA-4695 / CBS 11777 / NBRC 106824 / NRRL Y48691) TaxID=653667 RepID=S9W135_SCHCR|nr:complexed with Cdc5 protein Cwf3 [Schizosaccharomyces cryophilus OY26]EPY53628.1 complexed with Cdc5 protein Cwf3 [Schizosaccharomyces cryophilus OY26]